MGLWIWLSSMGPSESLAAGSTEDVGHSTQAPIRQIRQVFELPDEALQRRPLVEVDAVVTFVDTSLKLLFVEQNGCGIYVDWPGADQALRPGQRLRLRAVARKGRCAHYLAEPRLELGSSGAVPEGKILSPDDFHGGCPDSQWARIEGVVRQARPRGDRGYIELVSGPLRLPVWVSRFESNALQSLWGRRVCARGVVIGTVGERGQVSGYQLFTASLDEIEPSKDSPAGKPMPRASSAQSLTGFSGRQLNGQLVKVAGTVVVCLRPSHFVLQDATGLVDVETRGRREVQSGDAVEVTGFLSASPCGPKIDDASVVRREAPPAAPLPVLPASSQVKPHNQVVHLEGKLLHRQYHTNGAATLWIQSDHALWKASWVAPDPSRALAYVEEGSIVQLTGFCRMEAQSPRSTGSGWPCWCGGACQADQETASPRLRPHVWLRHEADLKVLRQAPRSYASLGFATAGGCFAAMLGFAYVGWQRRRAAERALGRQKELEEVVQAQEERLRRAVEERERISRDLHDNMIQSVYSAGLGLEDARRLLQQAPEQASERIGFVIQSLNEVIRNTRSFIAGLEPRLLTGPELKSALKSLALTTGDAQCHYDFQVDPLVARELTDQQATSLLHIAKEAIANSLRHGQPECVAVTLRKTDAGIQLEVADNGRGFDPGRPRGSGQGLRNINQRARSLGGEAKIHSGEGQGCRVIVTIPR